MGRARQVGDAAVGQGAPVKVYPVGLRGESKYQAAIRQCRSGAPVKICHESDNPHDQLALRVESEAGDVIGYIARDCWLRDAIHEQGRGCAATIKAIESAGGKQLGVVIDVTLTDDPIFQRNYMQPSPTKSAGSGNDALGRFLKSIFR